MFTLAFKMASVAALTLLILATSGCTSNSSGGDAVPVGVPDIRKINQANYMNGREFCKTWGKYTSKEFGLRLTVPKDYSDYSKGSIEIYAYTLQEFIPTLPSYIFVDGGPGQNTHGITDVTDRKFNEIRFDQRGLGCSAPESFEIYSDPTLYSTENTVRDMEEIRKAYGISTWSVYGISYGTIPATQYGAKFPEHTTAVVLEGVVGHSDILHRWDYKSSKINYILKDLSSQDRAAFTQLIYEQSKDTEFVLNLLFGGFFYQDVGLRQLKTIMGYIIYNGKIQRETLLRARQSQDESATLREQQPPQVPGGIDENVMGIIYCRELNYREKGKTTLNYSAEKGFFESTASTVSSRKNGQTCDNLGVKPSDEQPYKIENHPNTKNIYYFQGSHDGATMAKGAQLHWKTVPKGKSFFMLAQKGGHNPNLTRLFDSSSGALQLEQKRLFNQSLSGLDITDTDIRTANIYAKPDQQWKMWTNPWTAEADFEQELEGIRRIVGL